MYRKASCVTTTGLAINGRKAMYCIDKFCLIMNDEPGLFVNDQLARCANVTNIDGESAGLRLDCHLSESFCFWNPAHMITQPSTMTPASAAVRRM